MSKKQLKLTCPFCGGKVDILKIQGTDFGSSLEFEITDESCVLTHIAQEGVICPIAMLEGDMLGTLIYDNEREARAAWGITERR